MYCSRVGGCGVRLEEERGVMGPTGGKLCHVGSWCCQASLNVFGAVLYVGSRSSWFCG
jgi:hypothetical protein